MRESTNVGRGPLLLSLRGGAIILLLLTGCSALRRARRAVSPSSSSPPTIVVPINTPTSLPPTGLPAEAAPTAPPTEAPAETPTTTPPTEAPAATPTTAAEVQPAVTPTLPPLDNMTFVEKNNLYLDLLAARQAEGADTTAADELYVLAVEAMFQGDTATADQRLEEAILSLIMPGGET